MKLFHSLHHAGILYAGRKTLFSGFLWTATLGMAFLRVTWRLEGLVMLVGIVEK